MSNEKVLNSQEHTASIGEYYKGKSMTRRYVIIGFIVLLFVIQFLFPRAKNDVDTAAIKSGFVIEFVNFDGEDIMMSGLDLFDRQVFDRAYNEIVFDGASVVMAHRQEKLYLPIVEKAFEKEKIPDDLKYLVFARNGIENEDGGIWDIEKHLARIYDLEINEHVDERMNFEKASKTVASYLKDLYNALGDWELVLEYYESQNIDALYSDSKDIDLSMSKTLWLETLAWKAVMENRYELFDEATLGEQYVNLKTDTLKVREIEDLKEWPERKELDYGMIKKLNPWIKGVELPEGKWNIAVPK